MGESLLKRIIESIKGSKFAQTRFGGFMYGVLTELDTVTWPSKEEVYNSTVIVIITVVVFSMYSGLCDLLMRFFRGWFFMIYQ